MALKRDAYWPKLSLILDLGKRTSRHTLSPKKTRQNVVFELRFPGTTIIEFSKFLFSLILR